MSVRILVGDAIEQLKLLPPDPEYAEMAQKRIEADMPLTRRPNREPPKAFRLEFSPS